LSFSSARAELDTPTLLPGVAVVSDTVTADGNIEDVETGPLVPGCPFGARYHIIRLLGIGGMGAVYQAWDAELAVAVAIKVIRPEVMADPEAAAEVERRFKRELLLAREVTHKNVVRIHDLGEIDGIKYITMSYVDGTDLATILARDGALPVAAALKIARQVVDGLLAAHAASVVHRDLKPANIMISRQGDALIMDFGIAHSTGGSIGGSGSAQSIGHLPASLARVARPQATMQGSIVGTLQYMAPEQARGLAVDQRADIYAFGLIVYDMLAGSRRVGASESAYAELQARMDGAPPPVRSIAPDIPAAVDAIVARCVEPDADKRYQTTGELAAALNRLDADGKPLPLVRRVTPRLMAAVALVVVTMLGGTYAVTRRVLEPPKQHEPISVLIADFENGTTDPTFDRTLEPMLKRALEGASFISAFDRSGISGTLGVRPPERLDETSAREIAVKQGLGVVLSGSIQPQGSGYALSIKAAQTVAGTVIATANGRASGKDQVLSVATRLVTTVRKALGDDTSDSAQLFAMQTLSTTSLEVVRHFAAALEASTNNKFDAALQSFSKAVELDPKFGAGYLGMAAMSRNLGKLQDAEKYSKEALRYLDGMTERERYNARGMLYIGTGDYQQCVKEYGDLVARYAADVYARNRLALCSTHLRDMRKAVEEMREVVKIVPKRAIFWVNLGLYESYGGDFQSGEREARTAQDLGSPLGLLPLAFAQLGQNQLSQASETYQALGKADSLGRLGASLAESGLGDLALYEGRFSDAARVLGEGAAADLASKNADRAAAKFASLAYAHILRGQKGAAVAAAEKALLNSQAVKIRFLAARVLVEADQLGKARPLIAGLASEIQTEPQAHAKILEGDVFLKNGDPSQAIKVLAEANGLLDTWIGHFDLGRAYLDAGMFAQADSEFDRCIKRRGEALALFIDEEPTYGYLPPVYYYQGRAREGLKTDGFSESYREYLNIRGQSKEDPLLKDARRRTGTN
jgi:tetratricopeptide (TPR) repeat protein